MLDPKVVITFITGAAATAAAFRRDLNDVFSGRRSLASQIKTEQERIHETDKFLRELSGDKEKCNAARQALEADRGVALGRLSRLAAEFARQREDPNCDLSFVQRMFLLFRPEGLRAEVALWGAWAFMAVGFVSIFFGILPGRNAAELQQYLADLALLGCFGFLVLRGWALAERRAAYKHDANGSVIKTIFVAKRPANGAMIGAQACFWVCVYWVLESLEDVVYDLTTGPAKTGTPNEGLRSTATTLIKILVPLLVAVFCRQWAFHELRCAEKEMKRWRPSAFLRTGWRTLAMIASTAILAGSVAILVTRPAFFNELEHQISLLLQALISCLACSQWFALTAPAGVVSMNEPAKASVAAA